MSGNAVPSRVALLAEAIRPEDCEFWKDGRHGWAWPPEENEEWVRNEPVVAHATIDGERIPIGGYIARCKRCGAEYPVPVG